MKRTILANVPFEINDIKLPSSQGPVDAKIVRLFVTEEEIVEIPLANQDAKVWAEQLAAAPARAGETASGIALVKEMPDVLKRQ